MLVFPPVQLHVIFVMSLPNNTGYCWLSANKKDISNDCLSAVLACCFCRYFCCVRHLRHLCCKLGYTLGVMAVSCLDNLVHAVLFLTLMVVSFIDIIMHLTKAMRETKSEV